MVVSKPKGKPKSAALCLASVRTSRGWHGDDSLYFDAEKNLYVGAVSFGYGGDGKRVCRRVYGKTCG